MARPAEPDASLCGRAARPSRGEARLALLLCALAWGAGAAPLLGQDGDRDGDGVADATDRCPDQPETANGFSDADGCPDSFDDLVDLGRADVDSFWRKEFAARGKAYTRPDVFDLYTTVYDTPCGATESGNAMYCDATNGFYFDRGFLEDEFRKGDFGAVIIVAHEWGHLAQHQLGLVHSGEYDIEEELQADCFGGAFASYADSTLHRLEAGDLDEAIQNLFRAGNYGVPWFAARAHGRPGQRIDAFFTGYHGSTAACMDSTSEMADIIGIRGKPAPGGSLRDRFPAKVGEFELAQTVAFPAVLALGATDALVGVYGSPVGGEVKLLLMAFPSAAASEAALDPLTVDLTDNAAFVRKAEGEVDDAGGQRVGRMARLETATQEAIVWNNGNLVSYVLGPLGTARTFTRTYPDGLQLTS